MRTKANRHDRKRAERLKNEAFAREASTVLRRTFPQPNYHWGLLTRMQPWFSPR